MNKTNDQIRKLNSANTKGLFIWKYGILSWGLPTAILWSLITACTEGDHHFPSVLVISLMLSPVAGFLFGWTLWKLKELLWQKGGTTIHASVDAH